MNAVKRNRISAIIGMSASGKSFLAKSLIRQLSIPYLIYDCNNEYGEFNRRIVPEPDTIQTFEATCERVWKQGHMLFIVDEADLYLPNKKTLTPYALKLVKRGRHEGIGLWLITQRIADLSKSACYNTQHWFMFRMFLPNDIQYISQFIPPEMASYLSRLEAYWFLHYSAGQVELCPPVAPASARFSATSQQQRTERQLQA